MATSHFNVSVSGGTVSAEDWRRAKGAPKADLPKLTEEQREVAHKMGMSEEEYARGVLVAQYGEERQRQRGEDLGQQVGEILGELGPRYGLTELIRQGTKSRWVAAIETPAGCRNVAIPFELADDLVDSGTVQDIARLRQLLLKSVDPKGAVGSLQ